jgi:hypothetical protein
MASLDLYLLHNCGRAGAVLAVDIEGARLPPATRFDYVMTRRDRWRTLAGPPLSQL